MTEQTYPCDCGCRAEGVTDWAGLRGECPCGQRYVLGDGHISRFVLVPDSHRDGSGYVFQQWAYGHCTGEARGDGCLFLGRRGKRVEVRTLTAG